MKNISIVAMRMLAIYIIAMALSALPNYSYFIAVDLSNDSIGKAAVTSGIITVSINLIIGVLIWLYSIPLANLITKDLQILTQYNEEFSLQNIQIVAVSLVGLYILSSAIPSLVELAISYKFPATNPRYTRTLDVMGKMSAEIPVIDIVKIAVKLGLGFWLLLGSNGIIHSIRAFWAKGRSI